ncbi:hypothetical protein GGH12_000545 [Coemansia sp. RSA 1822]|nr:hypothetical protein LPJ76_000829 [Coemansia sp. RSA 638]KAJ2545199.1 hypothetical protein GGF49_000632 [Coemansia sp. RSA 1853]KAJ2566989.1 hypothetical protein GGH12_000545 [Coemansia sp. RSA 1822]
MPTTLGYAEPVDAEFAQDPFPSKIGGKPRWLDPRHALAAERVACDECGKPMVLLMQLSAPEDDPPSAFHRMLYVFICRTGSCHTSGASRCMRAFRSQLPEDNAVYTAKGGEGDDCDIEWEKTAGVEAAAECVVCGLQGNKTCSTCHGRRYCSRAHQVADWDAGHKAQCSIMPHAESADHMRRLRRMIFPEHVIVSEEEAEEQPETDSDSDSEEAEPNSVVPVTSERVEDSETEVDAAFMEFQRRIQRDPDQVLRYARAPDAETEPMLLVSDSGAPTDIPACEACGAQREFEFQVMPQMLNYLDLDSTDPHSIDWGTLLVFSCPYSCEPTDTFMPEVVCKQSFSSHGIGQKYLRAYYGDEDAFSRQFESLDM